MVHHFRGRKCKTAFRSTPLCVYCYSHTLPFFWQILMKFSVRVSIYKSLVIYMSDFPAFHITLAEYFCISPLFSLKLDFNNEIRFTLSTTKMVDQLSLISVEILLKIYVYVKTKVLVIITLYILSLLSRFSICDVISPLKVFISKYHLFSTE